MKRIIHFFRGVLISSKSQTYLIYCDLMSRSDCPYPLVLVSFKIHQVNQVLEHNILHFELAFSTDLKINLIDFIREIIIRREADWCRSRILCKPFLKSSMLLN